MQVDPKTPRLEAPGAKRWKLKYAEPLSNSAFNFNLRRYTTDGRTEAMLSPRRRGKAMQVDPIKPTLKPPGAMRVEAKLRYTAFKVCFEVQLAPLHRGESHASFLLRLPPAPDLPGAEHGELVCVWFNGPQAGAYTRSLFS